MFPHLYGFRVNISLFQEAASKELLEILEKCEGTKVFNINPSFNIIFNIMFIFMLFRQSYGMIHCLVQLVW